MNVNKVACITLVLFAAATMGYSQYRPGHLEVTGGASFMTAPEEVKDYIKMGFNVQGQYVAFLSPTVGLSFGVGYNYFPVDEEKFEDEIYDELFATGYDIQLDELDVSGNVNILELSIGLRPYLSAPDAPNKIFIFGNGTYNMLKAKSKAEFTATYSYYDPYYGYYESTTEAEVESEADEEKFGINAGAGIELQMGAHSKLTIQGGYRFIFTEDENTNFIGVTAGIIF